MRGFSYAAAPRTGKTGNLGNDDNDPNWYSRRDKSRVPREMRERPFQRSPPCAFLSSARAEGLGSVLGDLLYDLTRRAVITLSSDIGLRNYSDERFALDHRQASNLLLGQKLEGTIEVLVWRNGGEIR